MPFKHYRFEEVETVLDVLAAHGFVALDVPVMGSQHFVRIALWKGSQIEGMPVALDATIEVDVSLRDVDGTRLQLAPGRSDDELETLLVCRDAARMLAQLRGAEVTAPLLC
jgi:hypothetical protein